MRHGPPHPAWVHEGRPSPSKQGWRQRCRSRLCEAGRGQHPQTGLAWASEQSGPTQPPRPPGQWAGAHGGRRPGCPSQSQQGQALQYRGCARWPATPRPQRRTRGQLCRQAAPRWRCAAGSGAPPRQRSQAKCRWFQNPTPEGPQGAGPRHQAAAARRDAPCGWEADLAAPANGSSPPWSTHAWVLGAQ